VTAVSVLLQAFDYTRAIDHSHRWDDRMLGKPFSFTGRRGRLSYLLTSLLAFVLIWFLTVALSGAEPNPAASLLLAAGSIGCVWCSLAITAQRFHDLGASGWWAALLYVPLVGLIVWFVLLLAPGQKTANAFGPVPSPAAVPSPPAPA
jgi:uncharacterized membrane protein YhaH (DUF805 family)